MVDFLGESGLGLLVDHRLGYVEQIMVIQLVRDINIILRKPHYF